MLWKQCAVSQWFSVRCINWQYIYLHWQFHRSIRQKNISSKSKARMMKRMYDLIRLAVAKENEIIAYKTLDLLKLAFGEKLIRSSEPDRMINICALALGRKQYAIADYILGAYKPLMKNAEDASIREIIRQLTMLLHIAKRLHQEYLLIKTANCIFEGMDKIAEDDTRAVIFAVDALRAIGLNSVKMNDPALFKEANKQLLNLRLMDLPELNGRLALLLSVWMHQIVKRDHSHLLVIYAETCLTLCARAGFPASVAMRVIEESNDLVCEIAANPRLRCNSNFIEFLLRLSSSSVEHRQTAARIIVKIVQLSIELHGIEQGFQLLAPLLEHGRAMLEDELKFTKSSSDFRKKNLFVMMREIILLAKLVAKQDGKTTYTAVIAQFNACWLKRYRKAVNRDSVGRFCQLLMLQLLRSRTVEQNLLCGQSRAILDRPLFTEVQIRKLNVG